MTSAAAGLALPFPPPAVMRGVCTWLAFPHKATVRRQPVSTGHVSCFVGSRGSRAQLARWDPLGSPRASDSSSLPPIPPQLLKSDWSWEPLPRACLELAEEARAEPGHGSGLNSSADGPGGGLCVCLGLVLWF